MLLPISLGFAVPNFCAQSATFLLATLDTARTPKPIYHSKREAPLLTCNPWDPWGVCPIKPQAEVCDCHTNTPKMKVYKVLPLLLACSQGRHFTFSIPIIEGWLAVSSGRSFLRTGKQKHVHSQQKKHTLALTVAQ